MTKLVLQNHGIYNYSRRMPIRCAILIVSMLLFEISLCSGETNAVDQPARRVGALPVPVKASHQNRIGAERKTTYFIPPNYADIEFARGLGATKQLLPINSQWTTRQKNGWLIWNATVIGDPEYIRGSKEQQVDVNIADKKGRTALHVSAAIGDVEILELLLSLKLVLDAVDKRGLTPLGVASYYGKHECAKVLLANGSSVSGSGRFVSPLVAAIGGKQRRGVEMLLKCGADPCERVQRGITLAEYARETKQEAVAVLIEKAVSNGHQAR